MARQAKSVSTSPKKTTRKRRSAVAPKGNSGRPFTVIPLLFVAAVGAILFGANCRQKETIGTPDRPIASIATPMRGGPSGGPSIESPGAPPPGPGRKKPPAKPQNALEEQMLLGNPDRATGDAGNREHFLIQRRQYALSYNDSLRFPNWVSWRLSAKDIADTDRGAFVPDPDLPGNFTKIVTSDYNRSGYDRGHNCPSKDRTASREENDIAFYMSNITPQRHEMNAGPWEKLESYSRELAQAGNELYIICGHGFKKERIRTFGPKKIAIPDFGWKVVVVIPERDGNDRERIQQDTRVIAVMIPNVKGISKQKWPKYLVTVQDIEQATGLTLLDSLPPDVTQALKTKRDAGEE